jgi:hypothetical protein
MSVPREPRRVSTFPARKNLALACAVLEGTLRDSDTLLRHHMAILVANPSSAENGAIREQNARRGRWIRLSICLACALVNLMHFLLRL